MARSGTIFKNAVLLTGANLALRLVSMGFQVYLSGQVGAAGIGLLQLTTSVCVLAMTAAMGGIRTATMYLTAGELGRGQAGGTGRVLTICFRYSLLCSGTAALAAYFLAPQIAGSWIGDMRVLPALRLYAAFLPVTCLVGLLTGYYTAAGRVKLLVLIEILEQLLSMGTTLFLLGLYGKEDPGTACTCILGGSSAAGVVSLILLMVCKKKSPETAVKGRGLTKTLLHTAVPLGLADILRMGISTTENLIVPRRLGLYAGSGEALASYGRVCGMVFPVLMFPAGILYSLAELLIPELSRCAAGGRKKRCQYLTGRSLRVAYIYGLASGGLLFTLSQGLGLLLYKSPEVGRLLRLYALLVPMLYADAITDAVIKGMGQQVASVRYNTLTSFLDVVFLWVLLPRLGLQGYFISFTVTHGLNFLLSIRRLVKVTGFRPSPAGILRGLPPWALSLVMGLLLPQAKSPAGAVLLGVVYLGVFLLSAGLGRVVKREDWRWIRGIIKGSADHSKAHIPH